MIRKLLPPVLLLSFSVAAFGLAAEAFFHLFPERIPRSIEHMARAGIYTFEPDIGVVLRPNVDVRVTVPRLEREVHVRTFDHGLGIGFRDDGLQGGLRIAVLGDSYVFGYGVSQEESFPAQLEARMRAAGAKVDVINAGVPGFSPGLERMMLEKYLSRLKPDLVLVAVFENDFDDSVYYETRRFGRARTFLGVNSTLYQLLSAARAHLNKPAAGAREGDGAKKPPKRRKTPADEGSRIVQREIGRMAAFCRQANIRFAIVILPTHPPIPVDRVVPADAGFPVLDLGPRFARFARADYQNPYVGHLTPAANGWVARDLKGFIESEALIPALRAER